MRRFPFAFLLFICIYPIPNSIYAQALIKQESLSDHSLWCDISDGARYGEMVKMGDLNNDGFDDIVVFSQGEGKLFVYFGFMSGELRLDAEIDLYPNSARGIEVEDMNGDAHADLVVVDIYGRVTFYFGGPDISNFGSASYVVNLSNARTAAEVASAGDYDGDGINDVIVHLTSNSSTFVVYGFSVESGIPEKEPALVEEIELIKAKGNIGDINGDGFNDVIYRPYRFSFPQEVRIFLGPDIDLETPDWVVTGNEPESSNEFGIAVGSAGDINGDGYTDIFIGDPRYNPTPSNPMQFGRWGKVYIWFGGPASVNNPTGFGENPSPSDADFTLQGEGSEGSLGYSIASGDINGDQYSDLAVGDPRGADFCYDPSTSEQKYAETGQVIPYYSGLAPPDGDEDAIPDNIDNCPLTYNPGQENMDGDEYGDACDNCPAVENNSQVDNDNDGTGDECDECPRDEDNDADNDGICAGTGYLSPKAGDEDNCPETYNPDQLDSDGDGIGDACDNCILVASDNQTDSDEDGVGDVCDNCIDLINPDQKDTDEDRVGDQCDNCPEAPNTWQYNSDEDSFGDACDNCRTVTNEDQSDIDNDGTGDVCDNCILLANDQTDSDGDGLGDDCDTCPDDPDNDIDGDGICGDVDNCPDMYNPDQKDSDGDGRGDVCTNDLRVGHFEFIQTVQDEHNETLLVEGRPTFLRVNVYIDGPTDSLEKVTGIIEGYTHDGPDVVYPDPLYITAYKNPDPANKGHTLNFKVPDEWHVDFDNTFAVNITVNPDQSVFETDYSNNSLNVSTRIMRAVEPITVKVIKVFGGMDFEDYVLGGFPCSKPTNSTIDSTSLFMQKIFPTPEMNILKGGGLFIEYDPTESGYNGAQLLNNIWFLAALSGNNNVKYFGMLCNELEPVKKGILKGGGQSGMGWGSGSWGIRNDRVPGTHGGYMMAHEVGHTFLGNGGFGGVFEVWPAHIRDDCGTHGPYFEDYPVSSPRGKIDNYGFDGTKVYDKDYYYDFMSYSPCVTQKPGTPQKGSWISSYMSNRLVNAFQYWDGTKKMGTPRAITDQYLLISGILINNQDIRELKIVNTEITTLPSTGNEESPLWIYLYSDGEITDAYPIDLFGFENGALDPNSAFFQTVVTNPGNITVIEFKFNEQSIMTLPVSPNIPQVSLLHPNGGEMLDGEQTIAWSASDADGDSLIYDVLYSPDNGLTWETIALNLSEERFEWNTSEYAGCSQGIIKVLASDGTNTGHDLSDNSFGVARKAPEVKIYAPYDGEYILSTSQIRFRGVAYDYEDGQFNSGEVQWSSSIDGELGSDPEIYVRGLTPGIHLITLSAVDSDGNVETSSVAITISNETDSDFDGVADAVDNCLKTYNPDQSDLDGNGIGDACEACSPPSELVIFSDDTLLCTNELHNFYIHDEEGLTYEWNVPENWSWSGQDTAIQISPEPGEGIVSVTAYNQCGQSQLAEIHVQAIDGIGDACEACSPPSELDIFSDDTLLCTNEIHNFYIHDEEGLTYEWNVPENWSWSGHDTAIQITAEPGEGIVSVTAYNQCGQSQLAEIHVQAIDCSSRIEDRFLGEVIIYPNPSTGILNFRIEKANLMKDLMVSVYDIQGRKIYESDYQSTNGLIDLSGHMSGVYLIKLISGERMVTYKIVLE